MQDPTSSVTESTASAVKGQGRLVAFGVAAIVAILLGTAVALFLNMPDANAFNMRVERIFVENADLTGEAEIRLLEILARSGSAFSDTLGSYRVGLFILLVFATALLVVAFVFLVVIVALNRRMSEISRAGIQIDTLVVNRAERVVYVNAMAFELTDAAMETLAALCEARLDGDVLSGSALEALVTGKDAADCEEAAGATRIKRLRDALGNQMVSEVMIKTITRKGYSLSIKDTAIRIV